MLLRVGIVAAVVLGVLYVALPWLLPTESIRRRLEADLTGQLGAKVSVGAMHFRWDDGVVIDGMTIDNPPGFPAGPMVQVGRIGCDFSPLRFVLQRRIAWMEVEKLVVTAQDDEAGRLNTDCFSRMKMDVDTRRLRVRQSELSVFLHDQPRPLIARVSDMQVFRSRGDLGRVTMTGSFEQSGSPAPISLRISVGDEDDHAATVDCRFSDLDLAQLPRSRAVWGDLPIESLRGRCGGQLVFAVGKNLRVEELRLELLAENLEVKPRGAPPLPIIDQAGLKLQAELDALSERADVRKFRLRLPGVDLAGRGVVYADLLNGNWESLDRVQLHGTVHPDRLAALMTGRDTLPNGLAVRGPVDINVAARQKGDVLGIDLRLDASDTSIQAGTRMFKPERQPLRFQIQAGVDVSSAVRPMDVELARLDVGGNTITAAGRIADLSAFPSPEASPDAGRTVDAILAALRGVRLNGTVHLNEPMVLVQPFWETPFEPLELRGAWSGPWSFQPGENPKFNLSLRGGSDTVLRVGHSFAKPSRQDLSLELSTVIDPAQRCITDILLDVLTEQGRLSLDDTTVRLPGKNEPLQFQGDFEIDQIQAFRAWTLEDPNQAWQVSGGVKGSFDGKAAPQSQKAKLHVSVNMDDLAVALGDEFSKLAGEKARLDVQAEGSLAAGNDAWDAAVAAQFKNATFRVESRNRDGVVSARASADIQDASWLPSSIPALENALDGGQLAGPLHAEGSVRVEERELAFDLRAGSEKLDCNIGGPSPQVNPSGKYTFEGTIQTKGRVRVDGDALAVKLRVNAEDLGVRDVNGFAKPRGETAAAQLDVSAHRDMTAPQTCRLSVETAAFRLKGQFRGKARLNDAGQPVGLDPTEARLAATLKDASSLAKFYPALQDHKLAGRADVKLHWVAGQGERGTIRELKLHAADVQGEYRDKRCRLDGDVLVKDVDLADGEVLRIGRVFTENLEFAAGDNRGWLLADLKLKPGAPTGTFDLLFESLDDKDLIDWLSAPRGTTNPAASQAAASQPTTRTDADVALQERANELILREHDWFRNADLAGRVKAKRFRTYDANVRQHYPTRDFQLSLHVRDGNVKVHYDAGLYGGMVVGEMETDLTVPQPVVASRGEYMDVKATKTIQPQISRMFPGNTVSGRFSRTETVHYPLRDLVCNAMDSEYRLCPEGKAVMIAAEGLVVGKAAPEFVTKLFPGLNLTKYPYETMTAFTKFLPDGSTENETFFYGGYDLYMEGVTKRDFSIRYTVGLVLLGSAFPAEALRDWKQGRIPILKVKGRIDDGKLVDDTVSYPLPNESLFEIFVQNNIVYRTWVNLQKKPPAEGR